MAGELLRSLVADFLRTRPATTLYSALGFVWFSTRLFGSLRTAVSLIFDRSDRGIVAGKLFDVGATMVATVAVAAWVLLAVALDLATARGAALLTRARSREDIDRIAGASNGPAAIAELRALGLPKGNCLPCERTPCFDRDGQEVQRGIYWLTPAGRRRVQAWMRQREARRGEK